MRKISQNLYKNYIIEFIKQNSSHIESLENSDQFVFLNEDNNYNQCIILGNDQRIMKYNDYYCEISDLKGNTQILTPIWKDYINAIDSKTNGDYYTVVNFEDCVISYMTDFYTNVAATSEVVDWAKYLQNYMTNKKQKTVVLYDNKTIASTAESDNNLIHSFKSGFRMDDNVNDDDLTLHLLKQFDEETLKHMVDANTVFMSIRSSHDHE